MRRLEAFPAGRLRRANLHLSHSTATGKKSSPTGSPPLCVCDTLWDTTLARIPTDNVPLPWESRLGQSRKKEVARGDFRAARAPLTLPTTRGLDRFGGQRQSRPPPSSHGSHRLLGCTSPLRRILSRGVASSSCTAWVAAAAAPGLAAAAPPAPPLPRRVDVRQLQAYVRGACVLVSGAARPPAPSLRPSRRLQTEGSDVRAMLPGVL